MAASRSVKSRTQRAIAFPVAFSTHAGPSPGDHTLHMFVFRPGVRMPFPSPSHIGPHESDMCLRIGKWLHKRRQGSDGMSITCPKV